MYVAAAAQFARSVSFVGGVTLSQESPIRKYGSKPPAIMASNALSLEVKL